MVTNTHDIVGSINSNVQSYKYTWEIDAHDFDLKKNGEKLRSPKFKATTDETAFEWQLWMYLKSGSKGKTVAIELYNFSNTIVAATVSFGIVNDEDKVVGIKVTDKKTYNTKNDVEATWGFHDFADESFFLNKAKKLGHDFSKIKIECEIKIYKSYERQSENMIEEENARRLRQFDIFERLLDDGDFNDISFVVEDKILNGHKCILVQNSPIFAAMFRNEMREKLEKTIEIDDIKYNVLREMFRFLYAGKINLEIDDNKLNIDELLIAADKYCVGRLKSKCEKLLCNDLSVDNVVDMLKLADKHNVPTLKQRAIKLIVSNNLSKISNFKTLTKTPDLLCEVCFAIGRGKRQ